MKTIRAIGIGVGIWGLGVTAYLSSFAVSVMENAEQQANWVLFFAVIPLVGLGARRYYKNGNKTHGVWVGLTFFWVAALLDAIITVPLFVLPHGGSYAEFYADPGFWIIGLLFLGIPTVHWYLKTKRTTEFM